MFSGLRGVIGTTEVPVTQITSNKKKAVVLEEADRCMALLTVRLIKMFSLVHIIPYLNHQSLQNTASFISHLLPLMIA